MQQASTVVNNSNISKLTTHTEYHDLKEITKVSLNPLLYLPRIYNAESDFLKNYLKFVFDVSQDVW